MSLDPNLSPAHNFDLRRWKLTRPDGSEVSPSQLNPSLTNPRGWEHPDEFFTDPATGGMVFRCPNIAGTTPNSSYSRCELREMPKPTLSSSENFWLPEQGGVMRANLRIDRVSKTGLSDKRGKIVIGQIHGPDSEVVRLYFRTTSARYGYVYAGYDDVDNNPSWSEPMFTVGLGKRFSYMINLERTRLVMRIGREERETFVKQIDPRYKGLPVYFKAGLYNQNNTGELSDYAQVTFFNLTVNH